MEKKVKVLEDKIACLEAKCRSYERQHKLLIHQLAKNCNLLYQLNTLLLK